MLLNLLIPFVLTVGSGSKGLINLKEIYDCCVFLSVRLLFLIPFPMKAITEVDPNDLNRVILGNRIFSFVSV